MTTTNESGAAHGRRMSVAREVLLERVAQDVKWGEQNHPDGTGGALLRGAARLARMECDRSAGEGRTTWHLILVEEVSEALAEDDPAKLRAELIQVAAVAAAWVESIDRRNAK